MASRKTRLAGAALAVLVVTLHCAAHAAETGAMQSVLLLSSYQRPLPANVVIDDTLRRVVPDALGRPVVISSEFLDVEHFADSIYAETTAAFLHHKYERLDVGVIVAFGPEALGFVLDYRDRLFPKAPVVHLNITREQLRETQVPPDVIGWTLDLDPTATLALASRPHPQATRLIFVSGTTAWDRAWERRLREAAARLPKAMRMEFLAGLPTADVLRQLRALTKDSIVFTPGYFADGAGRVFTPRESAGEMASVSGAPIYSPYDTFLGNGVVGGYVVTFEDQAKRAGEAAAAILSGTAPAAIPTGKMPNAFMADWRQLRRWRIDESALPVGSVVLFRELSIWATYQWQIIAIALALILQALLIATLLIERRRRRIAEIESRQRFSEMARMNRSVALGEMAASIAHEINQPLGAMLNNANAGEMLVRASPPALKDVADIFADIKRDDQRAGEVITRIRGLARKTEFELRDVDLNATLEETLKFLVAEARVKGVSLRTELAAGLPPVRGDGVQIEQVVINLALNAMDSMHNNPAGTREITIATARANASEVEVSVADSGAGIPEKALQRVFEPFFTTKQQGMGLGLAISRTIVEVHGGSIWANNAPSGGAVFRFTLPFGTRPAS